MKHRNVMTVVLLSLITFGIYDLYWLVDTKKVLNRETDVHTPSIWLLFAPLLLMIALIIPAALISASTTPGTKSSAGGNIMLILVEVVAVFAIIPITFYWFFKFSKAVGRYTQGQMSTAMSFILLYLLRFIGIAVIQDHFNDMTAGAAAGPTPQMAGPTPVGMNASPVGGPTGPMPTVPQQVDPVPPSIPVQPPQEQPAAQNPDQGAGPQTPMTPPANPIQ